VHLTIEYTDQYNMPRRIAHKSEILVRVQRPVNTIDGTALAYFTDKQRSVIAAKEAGLIPVHLPGGELLIHPDSEGRLHYGL
jgi:hypothetical protein